MFLEQLNTEGRADYDIPYGATEWQKFDFFSPVSCAADVLIFIHGGYWSRFNKSNWSHLATGAVQQEWHVTIPSYELCPDVLISEVS